MPEILRGSALKSRGAETRPLASQP